MSSGAFSCQELADKLASAQTETAARVLTSTWDESGCTQRAAEEQLYRDVPVTVQVKRVVPEPQSLWFRQNGLVARR